MKIKVTVIFILKRTLGYLILKDEVSVLNVTKSSGNKSENAFCSISSSGVPNCVLFFSLQLIDHIKIRLH